MYLPNPYVLAMLLLGAWLIHGLVRSVLIPQSKELAGVLGMGALQVVSGFVTAPSNTFTNWTLGTGDSLTVKNAPKAAYLLSVWGDWQTAGNLRITSPRLHDAVQGIRLFGPSSIVQPLIYPPQVQYLVPQDVLTVQQTGSATAGDIESGALLIYYPDLPGSNGNFITYAEYMSRRVNILTVENTLALGTGGGYSGEEAINAEFDLLKANRDYAILGGNVSVECATIGWRGPDTGNVRVGMPGCDDVKIETRNWFVNLARVTGWPLIPVINAANKANTLIDGVQDENGADTTLTTILAELR